MAQAPDAQELLEAVPLLEGAAAALQALQRARGGPRVQTSGWRTGESARRARSTPWATSRRGSPSPCVSLHGQPLLPRPALPAAAQGHAETAQLLLRQQQRLWGRGPRAGAAYGRLRRAAAPDTGQPAAGVGHLGRGDGHRRIGLGARQYAAGATIRGLGRGEEWLDRTLPRTLEGLAPDEVAPPQIIGRPSEVEPLQETRAIQDIEAFTQNQMAEAEAEGFASAAEAAASRAEAAAAAEAGAAGAGILGHCR